MIIPLILQQIDMVESDLKVGSSSAEGVYVKDTQLLQFDWSKLYNNVAFLAPDQSDIVTIPMFIANFSSQPIRLIRPVLGYDGEIAPYYIDWYSIANYGGEIIYTLKNNGDKPVKVHQLITKVEGYSDTEVKTRTIDAQGIIDDFNTAGWLTFVPIYIIFDEE